MLDGVIDDVPFGTTRDIGEDVLMVQQTYTRPCGCRLISGTRLTPDALRDATLVSLGVDEARLREIAAEHFWIGAANCDEHGRKVGDAWIEAYRRSVEETPQDRPAMEVAGEILDMCVRAA